MKKEKVIFLQQKNTFKGISSLQFKEGQMIRAQKEIKIQNHPLDVPISKKQSYTK